MIRVALLALAVACSGSAKPAVVEAPKPLAHVDGAHGKLHVDDGGTAGTPVIFIHGLGGDHLVWKESLAHVRTKRRAIALDLHGFGESATTPTAAYSIEAHADDVVRVMDATRAERVILVGHSMGGTIASHVAAKFPQRVASVVLVDPSSDFSTMPSADREALQKSFSDKPEELFGMMLTGSQPGVSDRVLATLRATKPEQFKASAAALFAFDPKPDLASYKGPRVVIIGTLLQNYPLSIHKAVPGLDVHVLAETSHWPFLDKPAEFNAELDAFLSKVP